MKSGSYNKKWRTWLPFGFLRTDWYFMKGYSIALLLVLAGLMALVTIGDLFQNFDDFAELAKKQSLDFFGIGKIFLKYYYSFTIQLVLQYMLPLAMLMAGAITVTTAASSGNSNEFVVLRSVGVPARRTLIPLLFVALLIGVVFQVVRDGFIPEMTRLNNAIRLQLNSKVSDPHDISAIRDGKLQTAAMGWFSPYGRAHNFVLEVRDFQKYQRADSDQGDNDFELYVAGEADLIPGPGGVYQWKPVREGEHQTFTRYSRKSVPWTEPIPAAVIPAMLEREAYGDSVSSWKDLMLMRAGNPQAEFEMYWRFIDPLAACLLLMLGVGVVMGRMFRGSPPSYIQAVLVALAAAGVFYIVRMTGQSLWETGRLSTAAGVFLPIAAVAVVAVAIMVWLER